MLSAIVLGAGKSRRMGTQKLLLPIGHQPMIAHIVDEVLRSPVDATYVVVAIDSEPIGNALQGRSVTLVINPDDDGEMLSSVRAGLRALSAECTHALIVLGDQPGVTAELIGQLVSANRGGSHSLVVPAYGARRGHPLLISLEYRDEVLTCYDHIGLRGLLQAHPRAVLKVPVPSPAILADIDIPGDYRPFVSALRQ